MILVSNTVKNLSDSIAVRSLDEAGYFPVDKLFLNQFMEQILSLNEVEFLFYNIEQVNPSYANLLFLCLPEIWERMTGDRIEFMIRNFTNHFSYFILIEFTYKYIKVNVIPLVIECVKDNKVTYSEVLKFLSNQWNTLLLSDGEKMDLEKGEDKDFFQYNNDQWIYIRQILLLDVRIQPALENISDVKQYINALYDDSNSAS